MGDTAATFLERARRAQVRKGPACSFGIALATMEPGYRSEVVAAVADASIPATIIVGLLAEDDIEVGSDAVRRHRNRVLGRTGGCNCEVGS